MAVTIGWVNIVRVCLQEAIVAYSQTVNANQFEFAEGNLPEMLQELREAFGKPMQID